MKNRFKDAEELAAATREEIPKVAVRWLAAARAPLEKLTMAALDPDLTDDAFLALVDGFSKSLPGLLDRMDHASLANLMETGMGAAMANGISRRVDDFRERAAKDEKRARLPWETDTWLAGNKNHDPQDGRFTSGPGGPSRKQQRRNPTRREKIQADKPAPAPDAIKDAAIDRYRKGVKVKAPTGREVTFGDRAADHLAKKEGNRARFADLAEKTVTAPDEIWRDGLRNRYVQRPRKGGRNNFLVVTTQVSENGENVVTFTKQNPNKANPPGRKIYPAD